MVTEAKVAMEFLDALYWDAQDKGFFCLFAVDSTGQRRRKFRFFPTTPFGRRSAADLGIRLAHNLGFDVYVSCGVLSSIPKVGRGRKKDYMGACVVWTDLDVTETIPLKAGQFSRAQREYCLRYIDPQPSIIVDSGHGFHVYWKIPFTPLEEVERLNKELAKLFSGDRACDITRVLRLPGTLNLKGGPENAKLVRVVRYSDTVAKPGETRFTDRLLGKAAE